MSTDMMPDSFVDFMIKRGVPKDRPMELSDLKKFDLVYIGTPYTKYPDGIDAAFKLACKIAGALLSRGLKVYSPIAHTHPIAIHGSIDPLDLGIWLPFDAAIMSKSDAMLVAQMETWEKSSGVKHEIETFEKAGKPVFYLDPATLKVRDRPFDEIASVTW